MQKGSCTRKSFSMKEGDNRQGVIALQILGEMCRMGVGFLTQEIGLQSNET